MFDPFRDPLGVALKGRAREAQLDASLHGRMPMGGPLPDPNWEAWRQALHEATGGKRVRFGYDAQPDADLTRDPEYADQLERAFPRPLGGLWKSQQLGTPVDSLTRAARGR